jgi:type I restriction enzyme M protein
MTSRSANNTDLACDDTLWKAAEALRGQVDPAGFVLTPGRYVGAEEQEEDSEPFGEKSPRLLAELEPHFSEGERLTAVMRERLGKVKHGG